MTPFQRVLEEAARWGVNVTLVEGSEAIFAIAAETNEGIYSAPRNDGAILRRAHGGEHILWSKTDTDGSSPACGLLHEMAHVVMGGNPAQHSEELEAGPMFAIEHEAGRRLRIPRWGKYMVVNGADWSRESPSGKRQVIENAYRQAEALGVIRNGLPTYKRPPPQTRSARMAQTMGIRL